LLYRQMDKNHHHEMDVYPIGVRWKDLLYKLCKTSKANLPGQILLPRWKLYSNPVGTGRNDEDDYWHRR